MGSGAFCLFILFANIAMGTARSLGDKGPGTDVMEVPERESDVVSGALSRARRQGSIISSNDNHDGNNDNSGNQNNNMKLCDETTLVAGE